MYSRIRNLREDKDMNQTQMAKMLNISQTGYSKYETGENDIPTEILIALAEFHKTNAAKNPLNLIIIFFIITLLYHIFWQLYYITFNKNLLFVAVKPRVVCSEIENYQKKSALQVFLLTRHLIFL